jgi:hypothetical protein
MIFWDQKLRFEGYALPQVEFLFHSIMKYLPMVILVIGVIGLAFLPAAPDQRLPTGKSARVQRPTPATVATAVPLNVPH